LAEIKVVESVNEIEDIEDVEDVNAIIGGRGIRDKQFRY